MAQPFLSSVAAASTVAGFPAREAAVPFAHALSSNLRSVSGANSPKFPVRPDNINAALKMPGHGVVETGFMILVGTGAIYYQAKNRRLNTPDRKCPFIAFSPCRDRISTRHG